MTAIPTSNNSSLARWLRRRGSRYVSQQAPVILGGCHRSGTTLLRVMLDSHPRIACGPETSLFTGGFRPDKLAVRFDFAPEEIWQMRKQASDHAQLIEMFFMRYTASRGKSRWAEKTPQNVRYIGWILQRFPKAKFIHVIRDGRDTVCSMRTHPKFRIINGEKISTGIRRSLEPCIRGWLRDTAAGMKWRGHPNYYEVRYEDLVGVPEATLRKLCAFIGEPFDEAMLQYHEQQGESRDPVNFIANIIATQPLSSTSVGRWKKDLSAEELQLFFTLAPARMAELGYEKDS